MRIEHVAFNVPEPAAQACWWAANLGMRVVFQGPPPVSAHFLADPAGAMVEIYRNAAAPVPDYAAMDPLVLHLAFEADDVAATRHRLLAAGATPATDPFRSDLGDDVAVVRDPWGFPVQLIRRARRMV